MLLIVICLIHVHNIWILHFRIKHIKSFKSTMEWHNLYHDYFLRFFSFTVIIRSHICNIFLRVSFEPNLHIVLVFKEISWYLYKGNGNFNNKNSNTRIKYTIGFSSTILSAKLMIICFCKCWNCWVYTLKTFNAFMHILNCSRYRFQRTKLNSLWFFMYQK